MLRNGTFLGLLRIGPFLKNLSQVLNLQVKLIINELVALHYHDCIIYYQNVCAVQDEY